MELAVCVEHILRSSVSAFNQWNRVKVSGSQKLINNRSKNFIASAKDFFCKKPFAIFARKKLDCRVPRFFVENRLVDGQ
jgi:hypothetical protein